MAYIMAGQHGGPKISADDGQVAKFRKKWQWHSKKGLPGLGGPIISAFLRGMKKWRESEW